MSAIKRPHAALIAVFGMIIAAVAFAGPANAAPYTNPATSSVSNQTPAAGSSFTLSGSGFGANEDVANVLHSLPYTLTPARSNASGNFSVTVTLPAGVTGVHTIVSTGATTGRTATVTITIGGVTTSGAVTTGGGLAFTGADVIGIGGLAMLLILGGSVLLFAGRRRTAVSA
ncbi:MAG: hypothetical protein ACYDDU_19470 [Dermatophilaceae bacterium]